MTKLGLGLIAIFGAFVGWAFDKDAGIHLPARIIGRSGWAIMTLAILALIALPGCQSVKTVVDAAREGAIR